MERRRLLIFAALSMEARAIARALGLSPASAAGVFVSADPRFPIELHTVGIRATRLPRLEPRPGEWVIMAGMAGALDPALRRGDLIVDAGSIPWRPPACGPAATFVLRTGRLHTAEAVIGSPAEKAAIFRETGAAAVEMEQAIVRAAAAEVGLPVLGVRAISDTADEAIDPAVLRFVDDRGRPKVGALAAGLMRRPRLVGELRRLQKGSALANRNLAAGLAAIVDCFFRCGCCFTQD